MRSAWVLLPISALLLAAAGGYYYYRRQVSDGAAAYDRGDYQVAFNDLSPLSGWFDAASEARLSYMYLTGKGVTEDDNRAFTVAQKAAHGGSAFGDYLLGKMYSNGYGTAVDVAKAAYWQKRAATVGFAAAKSTLGDMYEAGLGVVRDYSQAAAWYQKAANQGDDHGEDGLAFLYAKGYGVPQDDGKALLYYKEAADQNDSDAQFNLGVFYLNGIGTNADVGRAVKELTAAAEQGSAYAEDALGQIYSGESSSSGQSEPEDDALAYMFYNLAAAQGNSNSTTAKAAIESRMTPGEVASAQAMSGAWKPGGPFPKSTKEDWATEEFLNSTNATSDVIRNTSVWFSVPFESNGQPRYAVFLKTKGTDAENTTCHACGAQISVVTYSDDNESPEFNPGSVQSDFVQSGSWGDVYQSGDPSQPIYSPKHVGLLRFDLGNRRFAILVPDGWSGMGETTLGYQIFVFDGQTQSGDGSWAPAGDINTSDEDMGNCDNRGKPDFGKLGCYSWKGEASFVKANSQGRPELIVHALGTAANSDYTKIIPAPDIVYVYNGQKFSQVSPPPGAN